MRKGIYVEHTNLRNNNHLVFKSGVIKLDDVFFLHQEKIGQQQFEYLTGNKQLSQEQISIFINNIEENNKMAKTYSFQYKHIVFPAKATVYAKQFKKIGIDIKSIITDECLALEKVYYPKFEKKHYYKDDTHTNTYAMIEILNNVLEEFGLEKLPQAKYIDDIPVVGDLSKMYDGLPRNRKIFSQFIIDNQLIHSPKRKLAYIEKFSLEKFCMGNSGHLDFNINPLPIYNKRVVLFGDSYFRMNLNLFSMIFNEVIYIRNPYIIEDIIKTLQPDIVLTGNAERYMINVPDSRKPKPYFLNYCTNKFKSHEIDNRTIEGFKNLFSGRYSREYMEFKKRFTISITQEKLENVYSLSENDLKSSLDGSLCRDKALEIENDDLEKAFHLMKIAHLYEPHRPFIKEKYLIYKSEINS
jgi:hypothetical protein